jgi:cytochrome bd-type quinol oxidase subunit 1
VQYPIFDLPIAGGSLLIACVAIFHVFIAHFSVGAGAFLVLAERRANRENDLQTLAFLRRYAFGVLLVPYVIGAMSGVGIWFVTAIVNPRAISAMIHLFVWGWAAEWAMFIVDVAAIYLYFYTWGRIRPAAHNAIGWVFLVASILTLVIINGVLSFMLTPGNWRPGANFFEAFLNPSFWPTSIQRILVSLALAGAGAILLAAFRRDLGEHVRARVCSLAYRMMLPALLCLPLSIWSFNVISPRAQAYLAGSAVIMAVFFALGLTCFVLLSIASVVAMIRREYAPSTLGALLLALFAFIAYASFEFVREGVRKPYVIEGYMYSTGVTTDRAAAGDRASAQLVKRDGLIKTAPWAVPVGKRYEELAPPDRGQAVFRAACGSCHQPHVGYNALAPVVRGWSPRTIREYLDVMHEQRPMMPPFAGLDSEKDDLTAYIATMTGPLPK